MKFLWIASPIPSPEPDARRDTLRCERRLSARVIILGFSLGIALMLVTTAVVLFSPEAIGAIPAHTEVRR